MSVLVKDMTMPRDCPMCPMAHWNAFNMISGCEVVPGKKYAIRDPEYANSDHRPDWCPLVDVPPHGRLIDADAIPYNKIMLDGDDFYYGVTMPYIDRMPTIIEAEEGEA